MLRLPLILLLLLLGGMAAQAAGPGFSAPDGKILLLTHLNTDEKDVVPAKVQVKLRLEAGGTIKGVIEDFTEDGILIDGQNIPLTAIKSLTYRKPERKSMRILGGVGMAGGILSGGFFLAASAALIALINNGSNPSDAFVALLLLIFVMPFLLLGSLLLFLVGNTPFRHDRYRLRKWYRAEIKQLSGE
jgi:hypothetical protein